MREHNVLAWYDGWCAGCDTERPLVVVEHGPRGVRAWLGGVGAEDRSLSYCCRVCGRDEHVPLTAEEDAVYDAALVRWDDLEVPAPVLPELIDLSELAVLAPVLELPVRRASVDLSALLTDLATDVAAAEAEGDARDAEIAVPALLAEARPLPVPVPMELPAVVVAALRAPDVTPAPVGAPVVHVLPSQRVSATDLPLLATGS